MKGPLSTLLDTSSDDSLLLPEILAPRRPKMRYKSAVHICSLPKDVLILLLSGLPLSDIVKMRRVNLFFHDLIDETPALWAAASLHSFWPTQENFHHMQKAANYGNVEALLKLGVTYMYSECLPHPRQQLHITGEQAAEMFVRFEQLTPNSEPFTWVFYRPPWSALLPKRNCCKSTVLQSLLNLAKDSNCSKSVYYCIGRTLHLLDDKDKPEEAFTFFDRAAQMGCAESAYLIWTYRYGLYMSDKASELTSVRALRNLVSSRPGCLDAHFTLCKLYAENKFGGISPVQGAHYVRKVFLCSKPNNKLGTFPLNKELTTRVRQILVDWLVEVSNLKHFSTEAVHLTVRTVDRYLLAVPSSKAELQLVGITALLLSTRFLGKDILTVREAAWVTDNTYHYEDVVHMMAQIVATLRGKFRVPTVIDFLEVLLRLITADECMKWLAYYYCEVVLLHPDFGRFPLSVVAGAALVLAGLVIKKDCIWNSRLHDFTGFTIQELLPCITLLHAKCSIAEELEDFKSRKLMTIAVKYRQAEYCYVSDIELISRDELQAKLEINDNLYLKSLCSRWSIYEQVVHALSARSAFDSNLNKSSCSGYDGDDELDCETTEVGCNSLFNDDFFGDKTIGYCAGIETLPIPDEPWSQKFSVSGSLDHQNANIPNETYANERLCTKTAHLNLVTLNMEKESESVCSSHTRSIMSKDEVIAQNVIPAKLHTSETVIKSRAKDFFQNENVFGGIPLDPNQSEVSSSVTSMKFPAIKQIAVNYADKENVGVSKSGKVLESHMKPNSKGFTCLFKSTCLSPTSNIACEEQRTLSVPNTNIRLEVVRDRSLQSMEVSFDRRLQQMPGQITPSTRQAPTHQKRKSKTLLENNCKTVILDDQRDS